MQIKASYKPWLLCRSESESHPSLGHALVERIDDTHGRLIAADGYVMGVFPVTLEPSEPVGLVKSSLLLYASRFVGYRDGVDHGYYRLALEDGWVEMSDGSRHPRQHKNAGAYPDLKAALTSADPFAGALGKIAIDPMKLRVIQRALGNEWVTILEFTGYRKPIAVRLAAWQFANWESEWDDPASAFALLMPCAPREDRSHSAEPASELAIA